MAVTIIPTDLQVNGRFAPANITLPAGSVSDSTVASALGAGTGIQASKCIQQYIKSLAQVFGSAATAQRQVVHVVAGATGTVVSFSAGATVAAGSASHASVDLWKNGATILSATITLDNTVTAFTLVTATVSAAGLVAGDVLEVKITITGASLPQGVFASLVIREDAQ